MGFKQFQKVLEVLNVTEEYRYLRKSLKRSFDANLSNTTFGMQKLKLIDIKSQKLNSNSKVHVLGMLFFNKMMKKFLMDKQFRPDLQSFAMSLIKTK